MLSQKFDRPERAPSPLSQAPFRVVEKIVNLVKNPDRLFRPRVGGGKWPLFLQLVTAGVAATHASSDKDTGNDSEDKAWPYRRSVRRTPG